MLVKHKRNFFKKLPFFIFSLILFSAFLSAIYFIIPRLVNNSFISPLARNAVYKQNSIQDILSKNNIPFDRVEVASDSSYIVFLKDEGPVSISAQKNISSQISSLQLILSRLTIEGKKFKSLDLRFDKPIIEF